VRERERSLLPLAVSKPKQTNKRFSFLEKVRQNQIHLQKVLRVREPAIRSSWRSMDAKSLYAPLSSALLLLLLLVVRRISFQKMLFCRGVFFSRSILKSPLHQFPHLLACLLHVGPWLHRFFFLTCRVFVCVRWGE
jgi:hypothetical protein